MLLEGDCCLDCNRLFLNKPVYSPDKKIIVFDMEGVLVLQKGNYKNGKREGLDGYQLHNQAEEVVALALRDFDKVAIWSTQDKSLVESQDSYPQLQRHPFTSVDQRIYGTIIRGRDTPTKNLGLLTTDIGNIVAVEDLLDERTRWDPQIKGYFEPNKRVVYVNPQDDLLTKYVEARRLVA